MASLVLESVRDTRIWCPSFKSPRSNCGWKPAGVVPLSACLYARLDQRIKLLLDDRSQWLPATTMTTNSLLSQKCNDCLSDEER